MLACSPLKVDLHLAELKSAPAAVTWSLGGRLRRYGIARALCSRRYSFLLASVDISSSEKDFDTSESIRDGTIQQISLSSGECRVVVKQRRPRGGANKFFRATESNAKRKEGRRRPK